MFSRACRHLQKKLVHPDMFFKFGAKVTKVASSEYKKPVEVYLKALELCNLSKAQREFCRFRTSTGLSSKTIFPDDPLVDGEDNSAPGLSIASAIQITLSSMYFECGKKLRPFSTEGCVILGDMADSVREKFGLIASCADQVVFTSPADPKNPIDLSTAIHDPSLYQADNPINVESLTVTPLIAEQIDDIPTGRFFHRTFSSDAELVEDGFGLLRAGSDGWPIRGPTLTRLHQLEDGAKYVVRTGRPDRFQSWLQNESAAMENETGLTIFNDAAERAPSDYSLPRRGPPALGSSPPDQSYHPYSHRDWLPQRR